MGIPLVMPKQGQSVEWCVILEWFKKKGDRVNEGDVLYSYETDKASFEFESPASGILLETFFKAQDDVPVLATVGVIGEQDENIEIFKPALSIEANESHPISQKNVTVGKQPNIVGHFEQAPGGLPGAASPRAKRKAQQRGVDLAYVQGSGPRNRIIERDVLNRLAHTKTAADKRVAENLQSPTVGTGLGGRVRAMDLDAANAPSAGDELGGAQEVALGPMRKLIGARMVQSLQGSAQLTMQSFADATALLSLRKQLKTSGDAWGLPDFTLTDCIAYVVAKTLPDFPELNCHYKDEKLFRFTHVHLAMAVDTVRGLMVPVVRFADTLGAAEISKALKDLAASCREGSIGPDFLQGGTFTITNLGMFGIDNFTPIINPPQVAILGINAISPRPVSMQNGGYELRPHIGLSMTIDHRAVDGAPGARFLKALCERIAAVDLKFINERQFRYV